MRKRITYRKLGMRSEHRWAVLRNMVTSLIKHERIMTTTAKAKELRRVAEKMVTLAKKGLLHHRQLASAVVREEAMIEKLFRILGPRYQNRQGGYTRVMKLGRPRRGDSSDMSYIEFVDREGELRRARPQTAPAILKKPDTPDKLTPDDVPSTGGVVSRVFNKNIKFVVNDSTQQSS